MVFASRAVFPLLVDLKWDAIASVQFPTKETLTEMPGSAEDLAIVILARAGLEGQVLYAAIQTGVREMAT